MIEKFFKKESEEVFYVNSAITDINPQVLKWLKEKASKNKRKCCRLCVHQGPDDQMVHEMFIVHQKGAYVRPHKHIHKCESFCIIEGDIELIMFNDDGEFTKSISLGSYSSGRSFYYRLSNSCYHMLFIRSDFVVFHETTMGPFNKEETIFAPWSPEDGDQEAQKKYMQKIEYKIISK